MPVDRSRAGSARDLNRDVDRNIRRVAQDLATVDADVTAVEGDVVTLQTDVLAAQATADQALADAATSQSEVDVLEAVVTALDAAKAPKGLLTASGLTIATDRLAGRDSASTGAFEEITVGGGLEFTGSGGVQVANNGITFARMQDLTTDRLLGRDTAGTGDPEEIRVTGGIEFNGSAQVQTSAFTGDVTKTAGGTALTIANDAVTNAKAANMAQSTIKGRAAGAGTGDPTDLTAAQTLDILATSPRGRAVLEFSFTAAQMTDLGTTTGYYISPTALPVGAMIEFTKVTVGSGFIGDVSAVVVIGDGDADRFITGSPSCFAAAPDGLEVGRPSGAVLVTAATNPIVVIGSASDFTLVIANGTGQMTVRIYYTTTV